MSTRLVPLLATLLPSVLFALTPVPPAHHTCDGLLATAAWACTPCEQIDFEGQLRWAYWTTRNGKRYSVSGPFSSEGKCEEHWESSPSCVEHKPPAPKAEPSIPALSEGVD